MISRSLAHFLRGKKKTRGIDSISLLRSGVPFEFRISWDRPWFTINRRGKTPQASFFIFLIPVHSLSPLSFFIIIFFFIFLQYRNDDDVRTYHSRCFNARSSFDLVWKNIETPFTKGDTRAFKSPERWRWVFHRACYFIRTMISVGTGTPIYHYCSRLLLFFFHPSSVPILLFMFILSSE